MIKKIFAKIQIMLAGALMSISDVIPGFSGGIALTIVNKLKQVLETWEKILKPEKKGDRLKGLIFYLFFISGSLIGVFGFSQLINLLLDKIPEPTFWFFLFVSFGSIFIFIKFNKVKILKRNKKTIYKETFFMILGFVLIITLSLLTFFLRGSQDINTLKNADGEINDIKIYILIYFAGFFSSAAMVTPGISGALIILIFGVYGNIYGSLYAHPWKHWVVFLIYLFSTFCGAIFSIVFLEKLYKKFENNINWFFIGTIIGSICGAIIVFHKLLIPHNNIYWVYISIAIMLSMTLSFLIIKYFNNKTIH